MNKTILKTKNSRPKTLYVVSLGCPKNLVDTEIMLGSLVQRGWQVVGEPSPARVLLVNTCAFIAPAAEEALDTILELSRHKETDPDKKLVVTGCLVSRYGEELLAPLPEVDLFVGVDDFPRLPDLLDGPGVSSSPRLADQAPRFAYAKAQPRYPATPRHLAYLKLAEGCSHRCTFCTIPAIRGPFRSRPLPALLDEARHLAAAGVRELNLIAQDTTAYGSDLPGQPGLAELLGNYPPSRGSPGSASSTPTRPTSPRSSSPPWPPSPTWRPTSTSPSSMPTTTYCGAWGGATPGATSWTCSPGSGSPSPTWRLRTTVMVGFPGETEEHFDTLMEVVEEVRFEHLGVFLYHPEEGTPAARYDRPVPRRTARARARPLKALQARLVKERLKGLVGTVQQVLVEGESPESEYLLSGRLVSQAPDIDGQVYITAGVGQVGEVQPVRLTRALPYDLVGEIVGLRSFL